MEKKFSTIPYEIRKMAIMGNQYRSRESRDLMMNLELNDFREIYPVYLEWESFNSYDKYAHKVHVLDTVKNNKTYGRWIWVGYIQRNQASRLYNFARSELSDYGNKWSLKNEYKIIGKISSGFDYPEVIPYGIIDGRLITDYARFFLDKGKTNG